MYFNPSAKQEDLKLTVTSIAHVSCS